MIAVSVLCAVLMDMLFAEPKRWHPLVGFGYLANHLEKQLNRASFFSERLSCFLQQVLGMIAWVIAVMIPTIALVILAAFVELKIGFSWLIEGFFLYLAIGYTSLRQHTVAVLNALKENNMSLAREKVAWMVSRDTAHLEAVGVRQATIESVLENGSDAVFAPLFWFVIGGIPAVIIYRLANTLDAMWGYKNTRFLYFGRFSARMDDMLNYLPSRLVALSYALLGRFLCAIRCWRQQANTLSSPNAGVVMTVGAGALNIYLGGDSYYQGEKISKPEFGCGHLPDDNDIARAMGLVDKTLVLWCVLISVFGFVTWIV